MDRRQLAAALIIDVELDDDRPAVPATTAAGLQHGPGHVSVEHGCPASGSDEGARDLSQCNYPLGSLPAGCRSLPVHGDLAQSIHHAASSCILIGQDGRQSASASAGDLQRSEQRCKAGVRPESLVDPCAHLSDFCAVVLLHPRL
eukprot:15466116-Alexandrium_andersonii.AAC.1